MKLSKNIRLTSKFIKNYRDRIRKSPKLLAHFNNALELFLHPETKHLVKDKALNPPLANMRSFRLNKDYRIHYKITKDKFLFVDIGNHEQLYGNNSYPISN